MVVEASTPCRIGEMDEGGRVLALVGEGLPRKFWDWSAASASSCVLEQVLGHLVSLDLPVFGVINAEKRSGSPVVGATVAGQFMERIVAPLVGGPGLRQVAACSLPQEGSAQRRWDSQALGVDGSVQHRPLFGRGQLIALDQLRCSSERLSH